MSALHSVAASIRPRHGTARIGHSIDQPPGRHHEYSWTLFVFYHISCRNANAIALRMSRNITRT
jgi:hypothetical protein